MSLEIKQIRLDMPMNFGSVNCYLLKSETSCILVDTGAPNQGALLEERLKENGCEPGMLSLIVITHGDYDHIGNAASLREKWGAKIAMHPDDSEMASTGNMFAGRKMGNALLGKIVGPLFGFGKSKRFSPDILLAGGEELNEYGVKAQVIRLKGHSQGSIGLLTEEKDLICGDLLEMADGEARLFSIMDNIPLAEETLDMLKGMEIRTVYPGHGEPFAFELFLRV